MPYDKNEWRGYAFPWERAKMADIMAKAEQDGDTELHHAVGWIRGAEKLYREEHQKEYREALKHEALGCTIPLILALLLALSLF